MESKAGSIESKDISHAGKVMLATSDLSVKVFGRDRSGVKESPNNAWQEAYSHASQYGVGAAANIRKNIKELGDPKIDTAQVSQTLQHLARYSLTVK